MCWDFSGDLTVIFADFGPMPQVPLLAVPVPVLKFSLVSFVPSSSSEVVEYPLEDSNIKFAGALSPSDRFSTDDLLPRPIGACLASRFFLGFLRNPNLLIPPLPAEVGEFVSCSAIFFYWIESLATPFPKFLKIAIAFLAGSCEL